MNDQLPGRRAVLAERLAQSAGGYVGAQAWSERPAHDIAAKVIKGRAPTNERAEGTLALRVPYHEQQQTTSRKRMTSTRGEIVCTASRRTT